MRCLQNTENCTAFDMYAIHKMHKMYIYIFCKLKSSPHSPSPFNSAPSELQNTITPHAYTVTNTRIFGIFFAVIRTENTEAFNEVYADINML